jgi:hypothetical protein
MNVTDKCLEHFQTLLPAGQCVICCKPIKEIGGRRMIAQRARGIAVFDEPITRGFENIQSCTQLFEGRELYLLVWGEASLFTQEVEDRARVTYLQGRRPWFCQVCGSRLCHLCGEVLRRPVASDYIFDDGGTVHCPILGADFGCKNPQCERYKDLS